MTVLYPEAFSRSPAAGFDGLFEWDFLFPAFEYVRSDGATRHCKPMDFDAVVERGGRFLVFETKEGDAPIPGAQVQALERAVLTGHFLVIILRAKTPEPVTGWDVWALSAKTGLMVKQHREGDANALVRFCRNWFLHLGRAA